MAHKLIEQLVELGLKIMPGKGYSELAYVIRYAKDRIKDGKIEDPKQVEALGQMAANAIGMILHKKLVAPPTKVTVVRAKK
jgi:hypothetical protein